MLTVEQVLALADEVAPPYRAVVLLGGFCCLRIGELAALRREQLDLDAPTVTVLASAGHVNGWVDGPPKIAAGRRVVTIPAAILRAHVSGTPSRTRRGGSSSGRAAPDCAAPPSWPATSPRRRSGSA